MTTTLPVPVRFELPNSHWRPVSPASYGVTNAAFLAVRADVPGDYTPLLTISGDWRTDPASLADIADESLAILRGEGADDVELVKRTSIESELAPAITQSLGAVVTVDARRHDVRQTQAIQALHDVHDPAKRVVLTYTLTCTYAQLDALGPEFQDFVASVQVTPGQSTPGG